MKYIIHIVSLICLCSCTRSLQSTLVLPISENYEYIGILNKGDQNASKYILFWKRNFNPEVKVLNTSGNIVKTIPLINAEAAVGRVTNVWATSIDSLYVYSNITGKILLMNNIGIPIYTRSISDYAVDDDENQYALYAPYVQEVNVNNNKELIFTTFWINNQKKYSNNSGEFSLEIIRHNIASGALMCKINLSDIDNDIIKSCYGFKLTDIIELSDADKSLFDPFFKTLVINNRFYLVSIYSKYVYELNNDLSIKRSIQILSDSEIAYPVSPDMEDPFKKLDVLGIKENFVVNILYNYEEEKLVVIVKDGIAKENELFYFPFKVLLFDKDFNRKEKDISIKSYEYKPSSSFIINGNLYIEKKNEKKNNKIYDIINL